MEETDNFEFTNYDDDEIIQFTHLNNSAAWKGLLTSEDYVEREKILRSTDIASKSQTPELQEKYPEGHKWLGLKYFILKNKSLPDNTKTSQIVSSCETLNRLGYCIHPGSNGKIEPALIICIGGVFTEQKFRGKGYAAKMINALNKFYDDLRTNYGDKSPLIKNMVITLYSEVDNYYEVFGYHSLHVPLHHITKFDEFLNRYCDNSIIDNGRYLEFNGYEDLVALHDAQFEQSLDKLAKENPKKFVFTVKPDLDIFKWFQERDVFIMKKTGNGEDELPFGFALPDQSHVIWHHNWNDGVLIITKIYISKKDKPKEETLKQLIGHAILEAQKAKLSKVQFWDEEIPIEDYPQLNSLINELEDTRLIYKTNGSVSAVRPPAGYTAENIIWDNNTKFCWF